MSVSIIKIGKSKYELEQVKVWVKHTKEDGERYLEVTISSFAKDNDDPTKAGLTINGISFAGLENVKDLQDALMTLGLEIPDPINEIAESVIWRPNETLDIEKLSLKFGGIEGNSISVEIKALCWSCEEEKDIRVRASFIGEIVRND
ncbi:MAG: hypothetical protein ACYS6W_15885 [Planctomycetota bacterium]|jgi:hypothetical protein